MPTQSSRELPRARSSSTAHTGRVCPGAGQCSNSGHRICGFRRRLEARHKGGETDRKRRRYKDAGWLYALTRHRADGQNVVVLYDLTSTYFESAPPDDENDKRRYGYSRDKRSDCVQVVIALIVTPDGFPIAYEVLPGNTADKTTLGEFLQKIETQYGKAERIWVMDRGIPTEEVLAQMRAADPPVYYLVGTAKGRLSKLERDLLALPWAEVRPGVQVKLLPQNE
ncbi:MAG TPA: IS1634 family transposase, partial [Lysobacter sp.]|nr:IS1634 family transposase [Lysobacter sp.]